MRISSPIQYFTSLIASLIVSLTVALVLVGCSDDQKISVKKVDPIQALSIFYTCDTKGQVYPCECEGGQAGGVTRRSAHVQQHRDANALLVDVGNNLAGTRPWHLIEYEFVLKAYAKMKYDAVNLGHYEAGLPAAQLQMFKSHYPHLLSANLVDASTQKPICEPYRIVEKKNGHRIGVIGVMSDQLDVEEWGEGLFIVPPVQAISEYLEEVKKQSDAIVVLAFADEQELREIASVFYEVDAVIGGRVDQPAQKAEKAGQSWVVYTTDKGKSIGELTLQITEQGGSASNSITMLYADLAEDESLLPLLNEFEDRLQSQGVADEQKEDQKESHLTPLKR